MISAATSLGLLGLIAAVMPVIAAGTIGLPWALGIKLSEGAIRRIVVVTFGVATLASLGILGVVLFSPSTSTVVTLAHWIDVPSYAVDTRFVFDLPAGILMTLTAALTGLIGVFSAAYLHQDPGFRRFFVLLPLFATGMMAIAAGDSLDLVYAGWEIVGLCSALLIAYFTYREAPVRHGLRAFAVYRVCDVALLAAAVLLHREVETPSLGSGLHVPGNAGLTIALLLVFASMGKAASFPFTGWLPRAMEGPTSSSAVFYGALSIHAGPFLLLRAAPLFANQPIALAALVVVGTVTALHATMVGRVQTDAKSVQGYASAAQVGIIFIELGFGLTGLALAHIAGHAIVRTWQLLRTPSILHDYFQFGALTGAAPRNAFPLERLLPAAARRFFYRLSLERWYVDDLASTGLLSRLTALFRGLDRLEQSWVKLLLRGKNERGAR